MSILALVVRLASGFAIGWGIGGLLDGNMKDVAFIIGGIIGVCICIYLEFLV